MSDIDGQTRSRRAVLAAAGGAVAALAAESLVRAAPAAAADHDPVKLGELNTSSSETRINYQRNDAMVAPAFSVQSRGQSEAIHAEGDVHAIVASSSQGQAVMIQLDGSGPEAALQSECVHGPAVWGTSELGPGIKGGGSIGVLAESDQGVGLWARSKGTALKAEGAVQFSSAGLGTVAKGASSAKVIPPVALSLRSKILVTLMSDPGRATLKYVRLATNAQRVPSYFEVHLVTAAPSTVRFAWFVIS